MTASAPRRSRSPCQSATGSAPASRTARAASLSSSDPGKVMTPIRTHAAYSLARETLTGRAQRGVLRPADALAHDHDRAVPGTAVQGDVVHAGPHDGQAAARLGQLRHRRLPRIRLAL